MGDYEKIEVEILENGWVECAYDWDGGAHNPNRSRMTAREFPKTSQFKRLTRINR